MCSSNAFELRRRWSGNCSNDWKRDKAGLPKGCRRQCAESWIRLDAQHVATSCHARSRFGSRSRLIHHTYERTYAYSITHVTSRHVASRRVTLRRVTSPHLASPRLASPHLTSRRVASRRVASRHVTSRRTR